MDVVITTSIIAFIFSILDSKGIFKYGLLLCFILISIPLIIHYDYGNDYMPYYYSFKEHTGMGTSWEDVFRNNAIRNNEYMWGLIMMFFSIFGKNGFFIMVATLSIIEATIYYKFIVRYISRKWRWLAVFVFLFSPTFYLLMFSMLRQSLTIALFLFVFTLIEKRKFLLSLMLIFLLSYIHSSALILFPFILIPLIPLDKTKSVAIILLILFIICVASKEFLSTFFNFFSSIEKVSNYADIYKNSRDTMNLGFGFLLSSIPFLIYLNFLYNDISTKRDSQGIVTMASLYFIVLPFSQIIPLIARVAYYFEAFSIIAIPLTYSRIKIEQLKYVVIAIMILMTLLGYFGFFNSDVFRVPYKEFHTIFSEWS